MSSGRMDGQCDSHATFAQGRTRGVVGVTEDGEVGGERIWMGL
jgi:hypothetical protein